MSAGNKEDSSLNKKTCSFCSKKKNEKEMLPGLEDAYICQDCVKRLGEKYQEIKKEIERMRKAVPEKETKKAEAERTEEIAETAEAVEREDLTPKKIIAYLDEHVIGQEYAKKVMTLALFKHLRKNEKSNVILLGPTGSGKTLIVRLLAKIFNVAVFFTDAKRYSETGYKGDEVESIAQDLFRAADYNLKAAERAIVFIDEVDGIGGSGEEQEISGKDVQKALLTIIEGRKITVTRKEGPKIVERQLDTSKVLFVCAGSFDGLEKIIASSGSTMGFGVELSSKKQALSASMKGVTPYHLKKFGFLPEFIGRFSFLTPLEELTEEDLIRVLTEPKNSLVKRYQKSFQQEGVELELTEDALRLIAKKAKALGTGARALSNILKEIMLELETEMFSHPEIFSRCLVTEKMVAEGKVAVPVAKHEASGAMN